MTLFLSKYWRYNYDGVSTLYLFLSVSNSSMGYYCPWIIDTIGSASITWESGHPWPSWISIGLTNICTLNNTTLLKKYKLCCANFIIHKKNFHIFLIMSYMPMPEKNTQTQDNWHLEYLLQTFLKFILIIIFHNSQLIFTIFINYNKCPSEEKNNL